MTSRRIKGNAKNWQDDEEGWTDSEDEYHSDTEQAIKESKAAAKAE